MTSTSHRLGRRTSHLARFGGRRGSVADLLTAATDPASCDRVARAARLVVLGSEGQRELAAANAQDLVIDELGPVRRPPSYRGMRNYIGRVSVPAERGHSVAWFESLNELAHIRDLLLTEPVAALASQSVLVRWQLPSGPRFHYPDLLIRRPGQPPLICDVTRRSRLASPVAVAQFALMAATAAVAGWEFELRAELPEQRVRTQAAIHACRTSHPSAQPVRLPDRLKWPLPLTAVAQVLGSQRGGMGLATHLIATRQLFIDFNGPLTPDTLVHREPVIQDRSWLIPI